MTANFIWADLIEGLVAALADDRLPAVSASAGELLAELWANAEDHPEIRELIRVSLDDFRLPLCTLEFNFGRVLMESVA